MSLPIFDCFDHNYKHPFGALRKGQPSIFNVRFPKTLAIKDLTLVMFRPGYKERFIGLDLQDESGSDNIYSCCFTPNNTGLHHYYFTCVLDGRRRYIKRRGASEGVCDESFHRFRRCDGKTQKASAKSRGSKKCSGSQRVHRVCPA